MSIKINVKMTEEYMYDFMLYHNYTPVSGLFSAMVGIVALWVAIQYGMSGNMQYCCIWGMCSVLMLCVNPSTIKSRAKAQVKNSEMFQKPLEYEFADEGLTVRQEDQNVFIKWDEITKAVSTRKSVLLYMGRVRALIFPKECMGEEYEEVIKMIHTHVAPAKVKIRHIH